MKFPEFIGLIPKIQNLPLPGEESHLLMAPPERRQLMKELDLEKVSPRKAAVMMLIYPNGSIATLVLILRNSYKGVHSSQVAFPGGKIEKEDISPYHAALRETEEEIGVPRNTVNLVRAFSEVYIPPSNFFVAPFLGYCNEVAAFVPDPREVSGIVEIPLSELLNDANCILTTMATSYSASVAVPVFRLSGHDVWGATAMMLSELKQVLKKAMHY